MVYDKTYMDGVQDVGCSTGINEWSGMKYEADMWRYMRLMVYKLSFADDIMI